MSPRWVLLLALSMLFGPRFASDAHGQLRAAPAGAAYGGFSYEDSWANLLSNPQVQIELELIEDQVKQLREVQREYYDAYRKQYAEVRKDSGGFDKLAQAEWRERLDALQEKRNKQLADVLLPNQLKRAKQVSLQMRLRSASSYTFRDPGLLKLLEIDEAQAKQLQAKAQTLQQEAMAKYRELMEEANAKLWDELKPEQKKKLEELRGDAYVPKKIDWREHYAKQREQRELREQARKKQQAGEEKK